MKSIKNNKILSLIFFTFLAKLLVSFGGILLSFMMGNMYGLNTLGEFFIFQIAVITVGVILSLGMNETIVLFSSRYNKEVNVARFIIYSMFVSFLLMLVVSGIFLFLDEKHLPNNYSIVINNRVYFIACTLSCIVNTLLSGFMKGVKKPAYAVLLENGAVSIICIIIILLKKYIISGYGLNVAQLYCYSTWIVTIVGLINFSRNIDSSLRKPTSGELKDYFRKNWSFYSIVLCGLISTSVISLYIGYRLETKDVAIFRLIQQVCVLISFSLIVLNAVMPSQISSLFKDKSTLNIENLAIKTSTYATIISFPIYMSCVFFPTELIGIFGKDIDFHPSLLIILASAQLFNVSTGSVASILKMCGHEMTLNKILIFSSVMGVLLLVILTPWYGLFGAIVSSASMLFIQNALSLYIVKLKLGISTTFYIRRSKV